jgi:hypothetical protein
VTVFITKEAKIMSNDNRYLTSIKENTPIPVIGNNHLTATVTDTKKSNYVVAIFATALALTSFTLPVFAQRANSSWQCYLTNRQNQRVGGTITIWWGHTPADAAWACNNWVPQCGNDPSGCYAFQVGR